VVDVDETRSLAPRVLASCRFLIVGAEKTARPGDALFPAAGGFGDAGGEGDIFEAPGAEVAVQPGIAGLSDEEEVGAAVAIVIADRHAGADRAELELLVQAAPHPRIVVGVADGDAGGF